MTHPDHPQAPNGLSDRYGTGTTVSFFSNVSILNADVLKSADWKMVKTHAGADVALAHKSSPVRNHGNHHQKIARHRLDAVRLGFPIHSGFSQKSIGQPLVPHKYLMSVDTRRPCFPDRIQRFC
jgi:hypothetical protein